MQNGYLIGIDIGTYSSKGVLVSQDGRIVASHIVPHHVDIPQPGFVEHDAEKIWWHDFIAIVKKLQQESSAKAKDIIGVGISGIGPCVLPIDREGNPLRPAILYGIDTRATKEVQYIERALGRERISDWTGSHLSSQASGPKILWIQNNEPGVYEKARWFLSSQAYLVYKLTGKASIDVYSAAGYAPLYDVFRRKWIPEAADTIVPLERLPKVYWAHEVVGKITAQAAAETGLAEGTPIVAGTTDAAAEALSVGLSDINDMLLMLGSSIFFIARTLRLVKTDYFWISNFMEADSPVLLGGMSTGGSLTTWFRDQFGQIELMKEGKGEENAYDALAKLASASLTGSKGLVVLPYFAGERTPLHDPGAKGVFLGLTLNHTKGDVYRALLEGVAYGIRHNLEAMAEEGVRPERILLSGGGVKTSLWTQLIADICHTGLNVPEQQIGASYGDAFLAGMGIGLFTSIKDTTKWVKVKACIKPSLKNAEVYETKYKLFCELYESAKSVMHKVHFLQERLAKNRRPDL